ncbi:MAG: double-strand break repair helicase AddA [Defluviicoccus sp.]|nr:double-strand break repair helicase AddA [Defluviicoccus sp.]MDE0385442.1 double-strand break repair helicase AddA [Defluviicoccus sp.]
MSGPAGQALASRPAVSAWVDASAGTGKTKVLADRVLRLLLAGTPPERILALTFTRAAAAEMANRIFAALGDWSTLSDEALRGVLADLLEDPPDSETTARARALFLQVLDAPGGMKIQTIHAFCQSVLGRFPLEARVDPHFRVMDERTEGETLRRARDAAIAEASRTPESALARAFAIVAGRGAESRFDELMAALSRERGRIEALAAPALPGIEASTHRYFGLDPAETEESILAAASAGEAFDRDGLRRAAEALLAGRPTDRKAGTAIAAWLEDPAPTHRTFSDYAASFLTQAGGIRKNLPTKAVAQAAPEAVEAWRVEAERVRAVRHRLLAAATAAESAALARIGATLLRAYRLEKARRGRLDYDDLIAGVQGLVEDRAALWVLYKLDGGIDHVLIDEAQDTNPRQWAVVRALAADFFAGESAREAPRTVFAVGDPKQSIYSFQGVEAGAFADMREEFRRRAQESGAAWEGVALGRSFRSTEPVLRAVDAVFADPDSARGLGERPVSHAAGRAGQAGSVVLWPPARPSDPVDDDPWQPALRPFVQQSPAYRLAEALAATIARWLADGKRLESRGRAMRAGDIMVLVRHRGAFVDHLVRALKQRAVGVAGIDRLVLSTQLAAMDLLALAEAALMVDDDLTLAAVLKGPLVGLDEEALFDLAHGRDGVPLYAALAGRAGEPRFERARAVLGEVLAMADFVPPFEFFSRILGPMGGRLRIVARLGPDAEDPIDEFLGLALDYEREHGPSLQGFVAWFRGARAEVKRDLEQAERDEVRVLTVHGAKGLQAPVVVLADRMQAPTERDPVLWSDTQPPILVWKRRREARDPVAESLAAAERERGEEEYRRLLYVAMTRAEDRLYVAGYSQRDAVPDDCWYAMVERALRPIAEARQIELEAPEEGVVVAGPGLVLEAPQTAPPDRRAEAPPEAAETGFLPGWAMRAAPAEPADGPLLAPSRLDEDGAPARSPGEEGAMRRGRIVHDILRRIPALPPSDPGPAIEAYLARPALALAPAERRAIGEEVAAVVADPVAAAAFAPGSRAEVPVVGRVGGRAYSGTIDRLAVDDEAVRLVEFKTDRDPPAAPEGIPGSYLRQIAAYRALLAEIYPDRRIDCTLVWTAGPTAMTVPDALLDAAPP